MPETLRDFDLDDAFRNTRFVPDPAFRESLRARLHTARRSSSPPSAFSSNGWRRLLFKPTDPSEADEEDDPMNNTSRLIPAFAGLVVIALVGALLLGVLPGGGLFGAPTPVLIEDFESGTLDGWLLDCRGHGCWYPYDDGATSPLVGEASDPENPFAMPDPPQGEFAAATDTAAEGTRILYRDLELAGRQELHLTVYYENPFGVFYRVPELSHDGITPTQLYRIDVMDPSAPVDSLAEGDILATIFLTEPGDPPSLPPTEITFDLSPWAGQTVRLRLVNVDNFGPMRAGVDNIYLERVR